MIIITKLYYLTLHDNTAYSEDYDITEPLHSKYILSVKKQP